MNMPTHKQYTAFEGVQCIATGDIRQVAVQIKQHFKQQTVTGVLVFDDSNGQQVDVDFRGTSEEVCQRFAPLTAPHAVDSEAPRRPGRPKLGVVAREITLLPRHWDWLNAQTGGASVALRKLVETASKTSGNRDQMRQAQEASYRFMRAVLGNQPGFEEVARALFAANQAQFCALIESWPADCRDYLKKLAHGAFQDASQ